MSQTTYPIPIVTEDISTAVQQEFKDQPKQPHAIMERIRGDKGENQGIALIIDEFSERIDDPDKVLCCGAGVYRLIEKAYELEGKEIPKVTPKICQDLVDELNKIGKEGGEYGAAIAGRLKEYNPIIVDYIENLYPISSDSKAVSLVGLLTYGSIERQILNDLKKRKNEAVEAEEFEDAAEIRDQIRLIEGL